MIFFALGVHLVRAHEVRTHGDHKFLDATGLRKVT
jgi:hypothetical protein